MKTKPISLALTAALLFAANCNIFSPLNPKPSGDDAKMAEAKGQMERREYDSAITTLTKIVGKYDPSIVPATFGVTQIGYNPAAIGAGTDPSRSEAYYLRGKCQLRRKGLNLLSIWDEINPENENSVPFLDTNASTSTTVLDSVFSVISNLHEGCKLAYIDLRKIEDNTKNNISDNEIRSIVYRLDYGIESFLTVTLELLADFDRDGWVSSADDKNYYEKWCNPEYADFSNIDSIEIDSIKALTTDPNMINKIIDSTLARIDSVTLPSIAALELEIANAGDPDIPDSITDDFKAFAENISTNITMYRYNDSADNDGDYYNTNGNGTVDKMIWMDYDFDGLIDVTIGVRGSKDVTPGTQIGDYQHWALNQSLYTGVKRDALGQPLTYWYTPENGPTAVQLIRFKSYLGPIAGEWVAGDFGVDEEVMEGEDNDRDGTIDEDTRIVEDTLDDDGDWVNTSGTADPDHMVWNDANQNGKIDNASGQPLTSPYNVATHGVAPNGEWLSGDWGVDEEIFDGKDNDGDGRIDEDVNDKRPAIMPLPVGYGF